MEVRTVSSYGRHVNPRAAAGRTLAAYFLAVYASLPLN